MIRLKTIIQENTVDSEIKKYVDELGLITDQIELIKKKLKPLQNKYSELMDTVLPVVNTLGKENIKTKKYVLRIVKQGHFRTSFQYKEGFINSLVKVNYNTKKILEQILDQTKKTIQVPTKIQIQPVEGVSDTLKKWKNEFKRWLIPKLKQVKIGNNELKKLLLWKTKSSLTEKTLKT